MARKLRLEFPGAVYHVIKISTAVTNGWLAEALQMGSPTLVSQNMSLHRKAPGRYLDYITRLTKE